MVGFKAGQGRDGVGLIDLMDGPTGRFVFLGFVEHGPVEVHVHFGGVPEGEAVIPVPVVLCVGGCEWVLVDYFFILFVYLCVLIYLFAYSIIIT
jgi:hypothetical protein